MCIRDRVYLFADTITHSMRQLMEITEYRRSKQMEHNTKHGITPQSVRRAVQESLHTILRGGDTGNLADGAGVGNQSLAETLKELEEEMAKAAGLLEYEKAALLRDQIRELRAGAGLVVETKIQVAAQKKGQGKKKSGWGKKAK